MAIALLCTVDPNAIDTLKSLRMRHLEYIQAHRGEILFGGPTRGSDGMPETMIIVLKTDDRGAAEAFIAAEPYTASGNVFSEVRVRAWSQVVPEAAPGVLADAISKERSTYPAP